MRRVTSLLARPAFAASFQSTVHAAAFVPKVQNRTFFSSPIVQSEGFGLRKHIYTEVDNESTPFEFNTENQQELKAILAKYPDNYQNGAVIPLLHLAQKQHGWLPVAAMIKVAKICGVAPMDVFETATFYTMFIRQPIGKYLIGVCMTTPCMLCDSKSIYEGISKHLGIHFGQTTEDGLFTLIELECLGACANAPMMSVNDDYYEDLTPETAVNVLETFKRGETPKVGVQSGKRKAAEPAGEKTSLFGEPVPPPLRTDGAL